MNHYMVIFDEDKKYAEKLASYLNMSEGFSFIAGVCSSKEELKRFCEINSPILALVAEKYYEKLLTILNCEVMILSSVKSGVSKNGINIYKYQSADRIKKSILKGIAMSGTVEYIAGRANDMKIIAFFSPVKRNLCTSLSLSMGQYLGKKHRTLYLNMEAFSGFKGLYDKDFDRNLGDLIYFLESEKSGFALTLAGMVERMDNVDIIAPFENPADMISVKGERWINLLEAIEKETDYEYLLLDLSEAVQGLFEILKLADRVITPVDNEEIEICKLMQYEDCLMVSGCDDVIKKTKKCNIDSFKEVEDIHNLCKGEFGEYVKGVLREVISNE